MAFPTGWGRTHKITIDATYVSGTSNLTNFPMLITLDMLDTEVVDAGSNSALNGGGDLRFSSDAAGTTQLPCEVVSFVTNASALSRECEVWVLIPSVSYSTNTDIYIWYNKTGESQPAVTDTYGRNAVWGDYEFMSHDLVTDSTGNYTGAFTVNGNPTQVTGPLGTTNGAYDFDGTGDYITIPTAGRDPFTDIANGSSLTVGAWFANDSTDTFNRGIHVRSDRATYPSSVQLGQNSDSSKYFFYSLSTGVSDPARGVIGTADSAGTWEKVVGVDSSFSSSYGSQTIYQGTSSSTTDGSTSLGQGTASKSITIGARNSGDGNFFGKIAQAFLRTGSVSSDWVTTEYNNQASPSTFATAGTPSTPSGGGGVTIPIFIQHYRNQGIL